MTDLNPELPIAKMNRWKENWTSNLIKTAILTVIFLTLLILMFTVGNLVEVANNFGSYRCNPLVMPFAGNFGYDTKENFNFCLQTIFNSKASSVFSPIYGLLGSFTDVIKLVVDVALGIRKVFSNFLYGVNNFVRNVRDKIQNVMFSIRMSFIKLNGLMARVYGTMYAVIWMGTSAMSAGFNLADNDLIHFLFEFCFHPKTRVPLENGKLVTISELKIGDRLKPVDSYTPIVTSVFRFKGEKTPMVQIGDVILSSGHYVQDTNKQWIPAEKHTDAQTVFPIPELVCINVTKHQFHIGASGTLLVADYDEHSDSETTDVAQKLAMFTLNGKYHEGDTVKEYGLGIDASHSIRMEDNSWKPVGQVQLGDRVWNSGEVLGVVQEQCEYVIQNDQNTMSEAQILYDPNTKSWRRASTLWPNRRTTKKSILYSLITHKCSAIHISTKDGKYYFMRDYREVPLPKWKI